MEENVVKWDLRFLDLARYISTWSKDPSTQTGAVIVRPNRTICSVGYNGFPRGILDHDHRYGDRDLKLEMIVHCEMNALLSAESSVHGCTLYTYPFFSCTRCAVHMIQAGIKRAVAPACPEDKRSRWHDVLEQTKTYFDEAGVEWIEYDITS